MSTPAWLDSLALATSLALLVESVAKSGGVVRTVATIGISAVAGAGAALALAYRAAKRAFPRPDFLVDALCNQSEVRARGVLFVAIPKTAFEDSEDSEVDPEDSSDDSDDDYSDAYRGLSAHTRLGAALRALSDAGGGAVQCVEAGDVARFDDGAAYEAQVTDPPRSVTLDFYRGRCLGPATDEPAVDGARRLTLEIRRDLPRDRPRVELSEAIRRGGYR